MTIRIHPTAEVSPKAEIGEGTSIWHHSQVREGVRIGKDCILGKGVYVDAGVTLGDHVKIQNYVSVYHGVTIEDGVFIGPHVCFTNDLKPRAINPDGSLKAADDWVLSLTRIQRGAALGANSTIRCGITIGMWAMIGLWQRGHQKIFRNMVWPGEILPVCTVLFAHAASAWVNRNSAQNASSPDARSADKLSKFHDTIGSKIQ